MDDLNVILPVYNEVESIEIVIKEWIKELNKFNIQYKLVICEDGSNDGTKELLLKIKDKYPLILNQKEKRRGYGGAVIDGIISSNSHYILCIDGDGQCNPVDFKKFWVARERDGILIGWRVERNDPFQRKIFSTLFKIVFKILFPINIHDPSAPYVLFKKSNILPYLKYLAYLKEGFWWGFVGTCFKKNIPIAEIKIDHRKRLSGETVVYKTNKLITIALTNLLGLLKLKIVK